MPSDHAMFTDHVVALHIFVSLVVRHEMILLFFTKDLLNVGSVWCPPAEVAGTGRAAASAVEDVQGQRLGAVDGDAALRQSVAVRKQLCCCGLGQVERTA